MTVSDFLLVKRRVGSEYRYHIVHAREPRFSIEVDPAYNPAGRKGCNFIKSIRLNNSWTGDYHRCFKLLRGAEEFFRNALNEEECTRAGTVRPER